MLSLALLFLLGGSPSRYAILQAEYARDENAPVLLDGLKSSDPSIQRLAARAAGRLERSSLAEAVAALLKSGDADVRREAVGALAQMAAPYDFASAIPAEKSGAVRAVIYESIGRARPPREGSESLLVTGLKDVDVVARTGAARGLETWIRLNPKSARPQAGTLEALRQAIRDNAVSVLRQFATLALNAAGDQDSDTFDLLLRDPDPQVRRLAVIGSKRWVDDPSPMVRLEALRVAGNCDRALAAVGDPSGHVSLAGVDFLGAQKCDPMEIERLVDSGKTWRIKSRALVSLARVAPERARSKLAAFRADRIWQARVYAANAASVLRDEAALAILARDTNPNVAAAALTTMEQALAALASDHSGLLLAAAAKLKGAPELKGATPRILEAIQRLTHNGRVTVRDERVKLIELIGEAGDPGALEGLRPLLSDRDPVVAALVAKTLSEKTGQTVSPKTVTYLPEPFPSEAVLRPLEGATARITMKGLGAITIRLQTEEAPATVAAFASLAEKGAYDGLTFHRVVPNFVLQGGSPGADEYDALTPQFMRDELGFTSNQRGTFGVSTRGHDTGDGQIFVNLIDNWRLDHIYTVFGRVTSDMDIVDRILEGDVIESVRVLKKR